MFKRFVCLALVACASICFVSTAVAVETEMIAPLVLTVTAVPVDEGPMTIRTRTAGLVKTETFDVASSAGDHRSTVTKHDLFTAGLIPDTPAPS